MDKLKEFLSRFLPIVYTVEFDCGDGFTTDCMPYVFLTMKSARKYAEKVVKDCEQDGMKVRWGIGGNQLWL